MTTPGSDAQVGAASSDPDDRVEASVRKRVRLAVTKLLQGKGLDIHESGNGLVITNPRRPANGRVHVDYADGFVSWERVVWDRWGVLENLSGHGGKTASAEQIAWALTAGDV